MSVPPSESLALIGQRIFGLFSSVAANATSLQRVASDATHLKLIIAEGERFRLWSANLDLLVPGHGSLDYRVREAESLA
jgi:hypothetical protein